MVICSIATEDSATIDGVATQTLSSNYNKHVVQSDEQLAYY